MKRCNWIGANKEMILYHDTEWGRPLYDDQKLFEFLVLDTFQAGLSWAIILSKRKNFRKAFNNYNLSKISNYSRGEINRLLQDRGIVRNKLKILATIANAKAVLIVKKEFGSFSNYLWSFVKKKPIQNTYRREGDIPSQTKLSHIISKDMKNRGFRFVGPTTIYAYMQGIGMVNDHLLSCFLRKKKEDRTQSNNLS